MKRILVLFLTLTLMLAMLTGCGSNAPEEGTSESEKTFEIKFGHVLSTDSPVHITMTAMSEKVKERTNGAVDIQVYPNGELASYRNGPEAVLSGAAYMFYSSPGQFSDQVPDFAALQAPFLYDGFGHYSKLMGTSVTDKLEKQAEEKGIHVLSLNFVLGFRSLLTDYEVKSVEDIKGLKIRVPSNPVFVKPFELMNANPSGINWGETYTSLQQGVVDAIEGTNNSIYNAKMYEVKNIITMTEHIIDLSGLFISKEYWETLPQEYRDIITEEIKIAETKHNELAEKVDNELRAKLEAEGVTYNTVDKSSFQEATKSIVLGFDIGEELLKTLDEVR